VTIITVTLLADQYTFWIISRSVLLKIFQTKVVENIEPLILLT